jgi:hypothetical protein
MEPKAQVSLDYQTDGTAWSTTRLVQDADGRFFIEQRYGADDESSSPVERYPFDEARFRLRPGVWVEAMQHVARLRGQDGPAQAATDVELARTLTSLLRTADSSTQQWVFKALWSVRSAAVPFLVEMFAGNDQSSAHAAVCALLTFGEDACQAIPLLVSSYPGGDATARELILHVLSQIKEEESLPTTLIRLAIHGYERDRLIFEARRILEGQDDRDEVVRILADALRSPEEVVRKAALLGLHQLGRAAVPAVPAIQELILSEPRALIRRMADNALMRIRVDGGDVR